MLRFVVALPAEARPLIERYRLRRDPRHLGFKLFRGAAGDVALIVSGPGKVAAAAATASLHAAAGGGRDAAWLNVGIVGHGERPVGEVVLAHKVRDRATGESWVPPLLFAAPCPTDEVLTVDTVEQDFAEAVAYEMEASGFYSTACRFAGAEVVHCLKVVSDGPGEAAEALTAAKVQQLVAAALPAVEQVAAAICGLSSKLRALAADPAGYTEGPPRDNLAK